MQVSARALFLAAILAAHAASAADVARPRMRVLLVVEPPVRPGQTVPVEVRLLDDAGAPVDTRVTVDVDVGNLSTPPERVSPGVYRGIILVPRHLPSTRSMVVLARAAQTSVETGLALAPGPAATLHVEGPPSCSEDAEGCRLDVTAVDGDGNPAAEIPFGTAELGRVSTPGWAEPGRWVLVYRPPRVDRERTERVTVELGGLRAAHELKLSPPRALLGFAPVAGFVRQGTRSGQAIGARAVGARRVAGGWLLGVGLEGWWWNVSQAATASGLRVSTDRSQLGAGLLLLVERPLVGRMHAMFSVSGGAVRVSSTNHVQGQRGVTDAAFAPTAGGSAGLGWRFAAGMPFVEVRSAWVGDAHLLTDPGAKWPLFLLAGFRLHVR